MSCKLDSGEYTHFTVPDILKGGPLNEHVPTAFLSSFLPFFVPPDVGHGITSDEEAKLSKLRLCHFWNLIETAESGQIRKNRTFSNLRGLKLCTSHILVCGCLYGQDY